MNEDCNILRFAQQIKKKCNPTIFQSEQIAEWSKTHPKERILEIDMPLSYGNIVIGINVFYKKDVTRNCRG